MTQQCAFASAGPLLWNCLLAKIHAQILSGLSSLLLAFLSRFFSLWPITLGSPLISLYCERLLI